MGNLKVHVLRVDDDLPEVPCCMGAAVFERCTCWVPVHDVEQAPELPGEPVPRPDGMCSDCACRRDSVERQAFETGKETGLLSRWEGVLDCVTDGTPFYCHDGLRRRIGERHPDGRFRKLGPHGYEPLVGSDGVPRRADGRPAFLCAGWAALRRKHLQQHPPSEDSTS